ncbi:10026_t:CDS:2 [Paraglomus occultum]|uniref:10026_t:CDS:1 n=1 Tax=Paraglomus occultum TaxID=144539 RepID=A0A9N9AL13_9GLOM|nr:10026_t:CDS:2 [Paraglomus occultum]
MPNNGSKEFVAFTGMKKQESRLIARLTNNDGAQEAMLRKNRRATVRREGRRHNQARLDSNCHHLALKTILEVSSPLGRSVIPALPVDPYHKEAIRHLAAMAFDM